MFSFRDHLVTVTPVAGANANQAFRLLSGNKIGVDPGVSVDQVPGFSELPFAIVHKSNKPKVSLEGMDAVEVADVRKWVGGIGGFAYTISIVAQRPGVPTFRIRMIQCEWSGGGGWQGEEGGSTDKIESVCVDIHMAKGSDPMATIFAKRFPR